MFVIIVGGGNTGSYLAKLLMDAGHSVKVVEERPQVLEKMEGKFLQNRSWSVMGVRHKFLRLPVCSEPMFWPQSPVPMKLIWW